MDQSTNQEPENQLADDKLLADLELSRSNLIEIHSDLEKAVETGILSEKVANTVQAAATNVAAAHSATERVFQALDGIRAFVIRPINKVQEEALTQIGHVRKDARRSEIKNYFVAVVSVVLGAAIPPLWTYIFGSKENSEVSAPSPPPQPKPEALTSILFSDKELDQFDGKTKDLEAVRPVLVTALTTPSQESRQNLNAALRQSRDASTMSEEQKSLLRAASFYVNGSSSQSARELEKLSTNDPNLVSDKQLLTAVIRVQTGDLGAAAVALATVGTSSWLGIPPSFKSTVTQQLYELALKSPAALSHPAIKELTKLRLKDLSVALWNASGNSEHTTRWISNLTDRGISRDKMVTRDIQTWPKTHLYYRSGQAQHLESVFGTGIAKRLILQRMDASEKSEIRNAKTDFLVVLGEDQNR